MRVQSKTQSVISVAVLLLILGVLVWGTRWLLSGLTKELSVTLVVAVITVGATLWTARTTKLRDRELQIQAQQSVRREAVITRFMESFWELAQNKSWSNKEKEAYIKQTLKDFMINGSMWLSDNTVKTFVDYRLTAQRGATDEETVRYLARLMLSFRSDLGHSNKNLSEKDMLDVFLNYTDTIFRA